ncbi:MAG TPA: hypothetical protein VJ924_03495, partial [Alphaproteobacteria bacterium]|nr:hypothetical protein [Alphaproteobacteria bacterium]
MRVAVVPLPFEPEPPKPVASAPAPTPEATPPLAARPAEQAAASSDHEQEPIEEPATMLIDDTPGVEPPVPSVDADAPRRRFSFRANEGADAKKPQTYEEWRRLADEERRREGGADPRFEYVPLESSQPAAPRVLIPPSADLPVQSGAPPSAVPDEPPPGGVPWVAAVESALMRAAAKRATDDGAAPAPSSVAPIHPHTATPAPADEGHAAIKVDVPPAESSPRKPPAKKRRFGFF